MNRQELIDVIVRSWIDDAPDLLMEELAADAVLPILDAWRECADQLCAAAECYRYKYEGMQGDYSGCEDPEPVYVEGLARFEALKAAS